MAEQLGKHLRPQLERNARLHRIMMWRKRMLERRVELAQSIRCLADNVYNEAAYEPPEGMMAVATVTMNRVADPAYPKTVCGVVYQRDYNPTDGKIVCQFSWTCKPRHRVFRSIYRRALTVARQAILQHMRVHGLQNVVNYHADYVHPGWRLTPVMQIGQHIFYASNN